MATLHCPTCTCDKGQPPNYPVTCPHCGVTYGPGGEVGTHRPLGDACRNRAAARGTSPVVPQETP